MPSLAEIAKTKAEIAWLQSALKDCADSQIRKVIELRLEERKRELAQHESFRRQPTKPR